MTEISRGRRVVFVALLFTAMGAATLASPALGIVATFILKDLSITRGELGWVIGTSIVLAAVLSPVTGWVVDRIGGKAGLLLVFGVSAVAFVVFGLAPAFGVLFVAAALSGLAQSGANPSTNKLIGERLPQGERGVTTGIKQSGVQAAITAAGLVLPSLAIAFGWRIAMVALAVVPVVGAGVAIVLVPGSRPPPPPEHERAHHLPVFVWWMAVYGFILGFAGAVTFFIALFAEESLGLDPRLGGLAVTVTGVVAFAGRIAWARYAERSQRYLPSLSIVAVLGVAASLLLLASTRWAALLWVGAIVTGASTSSWNSIGMLAVINEAGSATGRASGVVLLGFLAGLGIGPPIYGATVDATGSYTAMWLISIGAAALGFALVLVWRRMSTALTFSGAR
jgi:predicted MFS family arabinose efflux permease